MKPGTVFAVGAAVDAAILTAGWVPARLMVSEWQRREGLVNLHGAQLAHRYESLGVDLPMMLTALAIILCSIMVGVLLGKARRFGLLAAYVGYLVLVVIAWGWAFASISFDAFD